MQWVKDNDAYDELISFSRLCEYGSLYSQLTNEFHNHFDDKADDKIKLDTDALLKRLGAEYAQTVTQLIGKQQAVCNNLVKANRRISRYVSLYLRTIDKSKQVEVIDELLSYVPGITRDWLVRVSITTDSYGKVLKDAIIVFANLFSREGAGTPLFLLSWVFPSQRWINIFDRIQSYWFT